MSQKRVLEFIKVNIWIIFAGILSIFSFVLGILGYYRYDSFNLLDSAYNSLRLFVLEYDIPSQRPIPLPLEIARWLSPFVTITSVLKTIHIIYQEHFRVRKTAKKGGHYIICGLDNGGSYLAAELLKNKKKVIVIEQNKENIDIEKLRKEGISVLIGNPSDSHFLDRAGVKNCSHLLAMTDNDVVNIGIIMAAGSLFEEKPPELIKCYVHLTSEEPVEIFDDQEISASAAIFDIHIFNTYKNSARDLFNKHPLYQNFHISSEEVSDIHILILGFGNTGENIFLQAAKIGHFPDRRKISITVIDRDAQKKENWFLYRYKNIKNICDIEFKEMDVESKEFYEKTLSEKKYNYIVVCFENDNLVLSTALRMSQKCREIPIAIRIPESARATEWLEMNEDKFKNIFSFGTYEKISGEDVVINETLDIIAKASHEFYSQKKPDAPTWEALSIFKKESNRAQAEHIETKLYALGLYSKKQKDTTEKDRICSPVEYETILKDSLEDLARTEHDRWNAFHYIYGWETQDPDAEICNDPDLKKHCCLVSWDELDMVSKIRKENYKEYDRGSIKDIPVILGKAKYVVCKKSVN